MPAAVGVAAVCDSIVLMCFSNDIMFVRVGALCVFLGVNHTLLRSPTGISTMSGRNRILFAREL
jgi:hypothetical protein